MAGQLARRIAIVVFSESESVCAVIKLFGTGRQVKNGNKRPVKEGKDLL